jgi:clan AA aspartic protease
MMTGAITPDRKAMLRLQLRSPSGSQEEVEAVIDTGFNGSLTLPVALVAALALPRRGWRRATLADGSEVRLAVYKVTVIWDNQARDVLALAADGGPLLGMSLLYGSVVTLHIVDGGLVTIAALV